MIKIALIVCMLFAVMPNATGQDAGNTDSKKLEKALEYFKSEKYHEALMLLAYLDKHYKLNPRFKAYMGVCLYKEWEFDDACKVFDEIINDIGIYAPHECCVYYLSAAESYFNTGNYISAIPLYEKVLILCYDNEKGDALYRLGFCYMFNRKWQNAADCFTSAVKYYIQHPTPDSGKRIIQMKNMINGCKKEIKTADKTTDKKAKDTGNDTGNDKQEK